MQSDILMFVIPAQIISEHSTVHSLNTWAVYDCIHVHLPAELNSLTSVHVATYGSKVVPV